MDHFLVNDVLIVSAKSGEILGKYLRPAHEPEVQENLKNLCLVDNLSLHHYGYLIFHFFENVLISFGFESIFLTLNLCLVQAIFILKLILSSLGGVFHTILMQQLVLQGGTLHILGLLFGATEIIADINLIFYTIFYCFFFVSGGWFSTESGYWILEEFLTKENIGLYKLTHWDKQEVIEALWENLPKYGKLTYQKIHL